MFSLSHLFSTRSRDDSRAPFLSLNLNDSPQLGMTLVGTMLVLTGSIVRRSFMGRGMIVGGAALLFGALSKSVSRQRSPGASARRGTSARQAKAPGTLRVSDVAGVPGNEGCKLIRSIRIDVGRQEIFSFVRNVENAPQFLKGVESVQVLDDRRSHWISQTPTGESTEWYLEIINEHPGEMIAWQSLEGSDVQHAGSIRFESCADGGSEVKVSMEYHLLGTEFSEAVVIALGEGIDRQLVQDLGRLKYVVETRAKDKIAGSEGISF